MGIPLEGISDYAWVNYVKTVVPSDGYFKYYIDRAGAMGGVALIPAEADFIKTTVTALDSITGCAIEEVQDPREAQVDFFKVTPSYYPSPTILGVTDKKPPVGVTVTWRDPGSTFWQESLTIMHEIGHLFGLKHPYDDGANPSYTMKDTIMSYNDKYPSAIYTDSDIAAMQALWGPDQKVFTTGAGALVGTAFADKFFLENFDGYGQGSADVIQGFSATNGDAIQLSTEGAGFDPSKQSFSLWEVSNSAPSRKGKTRKGGKRNKGGVASDINTVVNRDDVNALIYNGSTGDLYVDRNGSAYGLGDGGLIAVLQGAPRLSIDSINWIG